MSELGPVTVTVDRCLSCGGLWLDDGEYQLLRAQQVRRMKGEKP